MRMSQKALSHLSSAMSFHGQWRAAIDARSYELAAMYARWRDESLALAGLPSMAKIDEAFDTVNGRVTVDAAA